MYTSHSQYSLDYLKDAPETYREITSKETSKVILEVLEENSEYIKTLLSTDKNSIVDAHLLKGIISKEIQYFSVHRGLFNDENFTCMLYNPDSNPFQRYAD